MVTALDIDVRVDAALTSLYGAVTVAIERIGPREARSYLDANTSNRNLNVRHWKRLQRAIEDSEWWMNGETIIFSVDGTLLNGQHRLTAIVASGRYVDVMVVRGIDREAFRTLDGGRIRTTGDVLSMDGERNANMVASAIQALLAFVDSGGNVIGSTQAGRKATPTLTARVLDVYPQIRDSVVAMNRNVMFRNQHGVMLHMLFSLVSERVARDFASVLAENHHDIGRPFIVFREALVRVPMRSDLRRSYAAKAIKAFNAELNGERPKMFKFLSDEEFPAIDGLDYEKLAESIG